MRLTAAKFFRKFCFCQWKKQSRFRVYVFVMFVAENRKAIRVPERAIGGVATSLFSSSITLAVSFRVPSTVYNAINQLWTVKLHSNLYFQYQFKFLFAIWVYHLVTTEILTLFRCFWTLYDLYQYYVTLLFALKHKKYGQLLHIISNICSNLLGLDNSIFAYKIKC